MAGENDFEKQAAEMQAPPPPKYSAGLKSTVYIVLLFLIFGLSCGVLGIWSWELQHYGNFRQIANYPNREVMQTGNMLFTTSILSILLSLCAYLFPLFFQAFLWFAFAVMYAAGAGILTRQVPFDAGSCSTTLSNWVPFVGDCKKWVGLMALSWALFALCLVIFFVIVVDVAAARKKRHFLLGH